MDSPVFVLIYLLICTNVLFLEFMIPESQKFFLLKSLRIRNLLFTFMKKILKSSLKTVYLDVYVR